jgi:hypothetical protein
VRDDSGDRDGWWLAKVGSDRLFNKLELFIADDEMLALHRLLSAMKWPRPATDGQPRKEKGQ